MLQFLLLYCRTFSISFRLPKEAELAPSEFSAGVPALLYKLARFRPRIVCFVGKGIWEAFARAVHSQADAPIPSKKVIEGSSVSKREKRGSEPFEYGIQPLKAVHSVNGVFLLPYI